MLIRKKALHVFESYFSLFKVISCLKIRWKREPVATCKIKQVGQVCLAGAISCVRFLTSWRFVQRPQAFIFEQWGNSCPVPDCELLWRQMQMLWVSFPNVMFDYSFKISPDLLWVQTCWLFEYWIFSIEQSHCLAWVTPQTLSVKGQVAKIRLLCGPLGLGHK